MPIEWFIDEEAGFIYRVLKSPVDTEEFVASFREIMEHPAYRPGMKSLTDIREVRHSTTATDVERIVQFLVANVERVRGGKAAVVQAEDVSYGMVRMLESWAADLPFEIRVFRDVPEACRWLGVAVPEGAGE